MTHALLTARISNVESILHVFVINNDEGKINGN